MADIGYGATFEIGDGASPEVFTEVAEVVSITPPGATVEKIDTTHLQSPNRYREKVASIKDSSDVSFTVNATPANLVVLYGALSSTKNFRIDSNTELDTRWSFAGFISDVAPGELSNDDRLTVEVTVTVTGASTLTTLP